LKKKYVGTCGLLEIWLVLATEEVRGEEGIWDRFKDVDNSGIGE
jgi:hypothetical protein